MAPTDIVVSWYWGGVPTPNYVCTTTMGGTRASASWYYGGVPPHTHTAACTMGVLYHSGVRTQCTRGIFEEQIASIKAKRDPIGINLRNTQRTCKEGKIQFSQNLLLLHEHGLVGACFCGKKDDSTIVCTPGGYRPPPCAKKKYCCCHWGGYPPSGNCNKNTSKYNDGCQCFTRMSCAPVAGRLQTKPPCKS